MIIAVLYYGVFLYENLQDSFYQKRLSDSFTHAARIANSNYRFEQQVNKMGQTWSQLILNHMRRDFKTPSDELDAAVFYDTFLRAFDETHRPEGTRLWAFAGTESNPVMLSGEGVESAPRVIMTDLFKSLLKLSQVGALSAGRSTPANNRFRALFGDEISIFSVGTTLEGSLIPVIYRNERAWLYWRSIYFQRDYIGGVIVVFPENLIETSNSIQYAANYIYDFFEQDLLPIFVPVSENYDQTKIIFPETQTHELLLQNEPQNLIRKLEADNSFVKGSSIRHRNYVIFRDYFCMAASYELFLIAPDPLSQPHKGIYTRQHVSKAVFLILYSLVCSIVLGINNQIELSKYISSVFLLLAAFPVVTIIIIGSYQIDLAYTQQVEDMQNSAVASINEIDQESEAIIDRFARLINTMLEQEENLRIALCRKNETDFELFELVSDNLKNNNLALESLMIYRTEQESRLLVRDKQNKTLFEQRMKTMSNIIEHIHKMYIIDDNDPQLRIKPAHRQLGASGFFDAQDSLIPYYNISESGSYSEINRDDKLVYHAITINKNNLPFVYLIFVSSADELQFNNLRYRISKTMMKSDTNVAIGNVGLLDSQVLYPDIVHGYWRSAEGKRLRNLMRDSADTGSLWHFIEGDKLYISKPLSRSGGFVVAKSLSLAELNFKTFRHKNFLALAAILMIVLSFFLVSQINIFLVSPFVKYSKFLNRVADGNFDLKFSEGMANEFNTIDTVLNKMIEGFKERQLIGHLVSGTFEKSFSDNMPTEALNTQRIEGAVLASDIRSFTTISESKDAEEVVTMLNYHLSVMSDIIKRNNGTIDKFVGDAIIAVFALDTPEESVNAALATAKGMMLEHEKIQRDRAAKFEFTYEIGIGIDFGEMVTGTLKTEQRYEYAIIGKPKTRSEELEAMTKESSCTKIIVSKTVKDLATCNDFKKISKAEAFELTTLV